MERTRDDDDLFAPSLEGVRRPAADAGAALPWRLGSLFYVAFFGGPLAAAIAGWLNGRRLGLTRDRLAAVAGLGVAAWAASLAITVAAAESDRPLRFITVAAGVLVYLAVRELEKDADRRQAAAYGGDDDAAYASLWKPGLAIVAAGLLSTLLALGLVYA